jgi:hypothetical protein
MYFDRQSHCFREAEGEDLFQVHNQTEDHLNSLQEMPHSAKMMWIERERLPYFVRSRFYVECKLSRRLVHGHYLQRASQDPGALLGHPQVSLHSISSKFNPPTFILVLFSLAVSNWTGHEQFKNKPFRYARYLKRPPSSIF